MATASRHWWRFGNRTKGTPGLEGTVRPGPSTGAEDFTPALDLVARMLRLIGEVPVLPDQPNLDVLRQTCETWARHVLTGAWPPGHTAAQDGHRAWKAVGDFLVLRRHVEQELVATSLADLRQAVVVIAEAVGGSLVHEHADTDALLKAVSTLQLVAADGSLEELRNEVRRAADQLHNLAAERDTRQRELSDRVTLLSDQVQILVEEVRQAQQVGTTDAMTGLLNRAGYEAATRRELLSLRPGHLLSLALIDLDDLKWVNDQHGHAAGDAAIRALADSLRATCRTTDYLARIGGDEFAVILKDADAHAADRIVGRFLQELWSRNIPVSSGSDPIRVSASVGIAQAGPIDDVQAWTERADRWMYQAKGMGKNRVMGDGSPPVDATAS
ncbi:MAG TPA: GGDEF domain-containing protein [Chloroflexota bacterium]|nr:GGDEF domain-containing protein [Chloroflexota bacterium]